MPYPTAKEIGEREVPIMEALKFSFMVRAPEISKESQGEE